MKEGDVVVGTVRARLSNDTYVVVCRDGTQMDISFEGEKRPLVGGDVVGRLHFDDFGHPRMYLKDSVLDVILEGSHKIYVLGQRPDLTARMLAKFLARSKSAVVSPGSGISIERAPVSNDEDLNWALNMFREESERRGAALNVIDVQALARANWQQSMLRDLALPADIEGNQRALGDLTVLLRAGFKPFCSRIVEKHSGRKEISVNFILPYSPFLGATGYAREIGAMGMYSFPTIRMKTFEARRFCAARTIALGMSHNFLGPAENIQADVESSERAKHLAACFADAAAALAFLSSGGRRTVLAEIADIKEASLFYGQSIAHTTAGVVQEGVLTQATHKAIRAAFAADLPLDASMRDIVATAARIARKVALPASRFGNENGRDVVTVDELKSATLVANQIGVMIDRASPSVKQELQRTYREEIRQLVEECQDSENASARLILYEQYNVPHGMRKILEEEAGHLFELSKPKTAAGVQAALNRDKLASRIKNLKSSLEDDLLQFGEAISDDLSFSP